VQSEPTSRRRFLRQAAVGAGIGALGAPAPAAPASAAPAPIATFREIFPQHAELVLRRSRREHERIEQSLRRADARPVTVAVYQMRNHCGGTQGKQANLARMLDAVSAMARQKVQVLAFPEMCLPGYFTAVAGTPAEAREANHALADDPHQSDDVNKLRAAAREAAMVLAFGFCERAGQSHYNAIGLIDADGRWLGTRRKNPLSPGPYDLESFVEPDPAERSAVFKTRYATLGISNCFDGEFPESIRRMRLDGAEVLLWCNAATGSPDPGHSNRINYSAAYAQANRMWVACSNAVAENAYGTSLLVGPSGEPLVILPTDQEAFGTATFNLTLSADWTRWHDHLDPRLTE